MVLVGSVVDVHADWTLPACPRRRRHEQHPNASESTVANPADNLPHALSPCAPSSICSPIPRYHHDLSPHPAFSLCHGTAVPCACACAACACRLCRPCLCLCLCPGRFKCLAQSHSLTCGSVVLCGWALGRRLTEEEIGAIVEAGNRVKTTERQVQQVSKKTLFAVLCHCPQNCATPPPTPPPPTPPCLHRGLL